MFSSILKICTHVKKSINESYFMPTGQTIILQQSSYELRLYMQVNLNFCLRLLNVLFFRHLVLKKTVLTKLLHVMAHLLFEHH